MDEQRTRRKGGIGGGWDGLLLQRGASAIFSSISDAVCHFGGTTRHKRTWEDTSSYKEDIRGQRSTSEHFGDIRGHTRTYDDIEYTDIQRHT